MSPFIGVGQYASLGSGVMLILLGIVHIGKQTSVLCEPKEGKGNDDGDSCFGPGLEWNTGDEGFIDDTNEKWRDVYSLVPAKAARDLAPLLLGLYLVLVHMKDFPEKNDLLGIAQSWGRHSVFLLVAALFAAFGYAGNLGIITGFTVAFASGMALAIEFQYEDAPLSLQNESPKFGGCFSSETGGNWPTNLANIAVKLSILAAILTLFVGVATIVQRLPGPCASAEEDGKKRRMLKKDKDDKDGKGPGGASGASKTSSNGGALSCVGPGLFWADDGVDFAEDLNGDFDERWRTFFSLEPEVFVDNFTPFLFGVVSVIIVFSSTRLLWLSSSWARIMLWHLLQAFVANFGYAGNLGILTGLVSSGVAMLAFFLLLYTEPPTQRRAELRYLDDFGWQRKSVSAGSGGRGPQGGGRNVVANSPWNVNNL